MAVTTSISGVDDIVRKLKLLPERVGKNAMRRALRKGANVIRDQARTNAKAIDDPLTRAVIAKNISVASGGARRERQEGGVMMRVGVRGGARHREDPDLSSNPGGNTTHWRWVEFGTSEIPARPFMRSAMASAAEKSIQVTIAAMQTEVDKEVRKLVGS